MYDMYYCCDFPNPEVPTFGGGGCTFAEDPCAHRITHFESREYSNVPLDPQNILHNSIGVYTKWKIAKLKGYP